MVPVSLANGLDVNTTSTTTTGDGIVYQHCLRQLYPVFRPMTRPRFRKFWEEWAGEAAYEDY